MIHNLQRPSLHTAPRLQHCTCSCNPTAHVVRRQHVHWVVTQPVAAGSSDSRRCIDTVLQTVDTCHIEHAAQAYAGQKGTAAHCNRHLEEVSYHRMNSLLTCDVKPHHTSNLLAASPTI